MDKEKLINTLQAHLKSVQDVGTDLYIRRLKLTIRLLEEDYYTHNDEELVRDLQSLGFQDLAVQVRKIRYI